MAVFLRNRKKKAERRATRERKWLQKYINIQYVFLGEPFRSSPRAQSSLYPFIETPRTNKTKKKARGKLHGIYLLEIDCLQVHNSFCTLSTTSCKLYSL